MGFHYLNISCMLRIVGVRSAVLKAMVIEPSISNQINAETK